jgi:3-methyl-2-oxobutanoate hydroxymethyltransferase
MNPPMTVPRFVAQKRTGPKLAVLTAYDYPTARVFDEAGVDALLVGDTLGVVVQGRANTLGVTMDQMVYHTEMVSRAAKCALVIGDMPFLSYQADVAEAVRNAGRFIKEGGAHAVKLEGGRRSAAAIRAIAEAHIPVMGHVGLTPQSIQKFGAHRVQRNEDEILADAHAVEAAGAFAIVLETIPASLAKRITDALSIPTIGIGAGRYCDGQVLVWYDALGWNVEFHARYVQRFAELHRVLLDGATAFCDAVRCGTYPNDAHSYR